MKSCLSGIAVTVLLLCFTGSVSAEMLGMSSIKEIESVQVITQEVVISWTSQYEISVRGNNRTRIKLASQMLKNAMVNNAIVGDLVKTVQEGGRIDRKHLKGCRTISSDLSGGIKYFIAGNFQLVRKIIIKVETLIELQPAPDNLSFIVKQFNKITLQIKTSFKLKQKTINELETISKGSKDKVGSTKDKVGSTKVKVGSTKDKVGSTKVKVGSTKDKVGSTKVKVGSNGTTGSGTGTGTTGTDCQANSQSCLDLLGIDTTVVTNWDKIDWTYWTSTSLTTLTTTIDVTTVNWITIIKVDGTINWGGITCTGDPGIACYTCINGILSTNDSLPCDDGNSCTTNDHCSSGACVGTRDLSPVVPCN